MTLTPEDHPNAARWRNIFNPPPSRTHGRPLLSERTIAALAEDNRELFELHDANMRRLREAFRMEDFDA